MIKLYISKQATAAAWQAFLHSSCMQNCKLLEISNSMWTEAQHFNPF